MNNPLLYMYFVHLCMQGKGVSRDQLCSGTAKGAEGHAADIAFKQAKDNRSAMAECGFIIKSF